MKNTSLFKYNMHNWNFQTTPFKVTIQVCTSATNISFQDWFQVWCYSWKSIHTVYKQWYIAKTRTLNRLFHPVIFYTHYGLLPCMHCVKGGIDLAWVIGPLLRTWQIEQTTELWQTCTRKWINWLVLQPYPGFSPLRVCDSVYVEIHWAFTWQDKFS